MNHPSHLGFNPGKRKSTQKSVVPRASALVELMESRLLLSATIAGAAPKVVSAAEISGTVYNDINGDGVKDNGEVGIAGVVVYQDPNYNHKLDSTEQHVLTDASGNYVFTNLPADPEILRLVLPAGFKQTFPANGIGQFVGKNTGQKLTGVNFGISKSTATISGKVFNDINSDGIDNDGAGGVDNVRIYVDLKNTGSFVVGDPATTTDESGDYFISGLPAGSYTVREVVPQFDEQSLPNDFNGGIAVKLSAGQTLTGVTFGLITPKFPPTEEISGTVFNDANHNGIQDAGEKGIAGVTVYQDPNYNHKLDGSEQFTVTDGNGDYAFTDPPADPEIIRIILPTGDTQAFPANNAGQFVGKNNAQQLTGINFGVTVPTSAISGTVFNDLNHNGIQDPGEHGLAGVVVYGDPNYNHKIDAGELHMVTDANGNYSFTNPTSDPLIIRIVLPTGDIQTFPAGGGGQQTANHGYVLGGLLTGMDFGVFIPTAGHNSTITGSVFGDSNGDHKLDSGEGYIGGAIVYLDLNHDKKFDTGDESTSTLNGFFTFLGVAPGTYSIGFDTGADPEDLVTAPAGGFATVTIGAGQTVSAGMFGVQSEGAASPTAAAIGGLVFLDVDKDGFLGVNEPGINGVMVYIDLHNTGSYVAGDPFATTNPLGEYGIANIPPGNYTIREVVPAGYTQLTPASNGGFPVSLHAGEELTAFIFGLTKSV